MGMESRFNHYDVYGYLLSGLLSLLLLAGGCAVCGIAVHPPSLGVTIVIVAFSYYVGHMLHTWSNPLFDTRWVKAGDKTRYAPSQFYLLEENDDFTTEQRDRLLGTESASVPDGNEASRAYRAFLACRSKVLAKSRGLPFEHYQGFYALEAGIGFASILVMMSCLGAVAGASIHVETCECAQIVCYVVAGICGLALVVTEWMAHSSFDRPSSKREEGDSLRWVRMVAWLLISLLLGCVLLSPHARGREHPELLWIYVVAMLLVFLRSRVEYRKWSSLFARGVLRERLTQIDRQGDNVDEHHAAEQA